MIRLRVKFESGLEMEYVGTRDFVKMLWELYVQHAPVKAMAADEWCNQLAWRNVKGTPNFCKL